MKIKFLPRTKLGLYTVLIMALTIIFFIVRSLISWNFVYSGFNFIIKSPFYITLSFIIFALGVINCILGFIAIDKNRDQSILVFLAIILGINNIVGFLFFIAHIFFIS